MTTSTAPNDTPKKRGPYKPRAKTGKNGNGKLDPRDAEIAQLREQLARKATLDPIPVASEENRPGTLIKVGVDASGSPVMAKIRYSKSWLANPQNSAQVTFTPLHSMVVGPFGLSYTLTAEEEFHGPKVVQDFYSEALRNEKEQAKRYPPLTPAEMYDLDVRAASAPGKHYSRLFKLGAVGLSVRESTEDVG